MAIAKKDLPAYVRKCWLAAQKANEANRKAEIKRLKFYVGGDLQWDEETLRLRRAKNRPIITINKCKPAVDQIEGDIRLNPPGPDVHPIGGGADGDTADIIEGLIREVEYRSDAKTAYSTAGKYSAAGGYGCLELATEYVDDRSFAQRLRILSVEDPSAVFFDPAAREANRQDASWAGKLKSYSREEYSSLFGSKRRVLQPNGLQAAMGWISDALGVSGDMAKLREWTGGGSGPFYVCEFYNVEIETEKLRMYTDHVARFDDEPVPSNAKAREGEENVRSVGRRTIRKYVVDAFEVLDETEWQGRIIPLIPVLGPEVYIEGKLHRLSLIEPAMQSQEALNYLATTLTELAGMLPKSPWIGWEGQFDDPRWQTANSEMWAYLEVKPAYGTNDLGEQELLPAPQRNMWEAPIQWILASLGYFSDSIKATTAIYDPSLGAQKGQQSGTAIEQLRSESSVGNYSYADNLYRAIGVMYREMVNIFPKIMDGQRVVSIIKPDSQHEAVEINREFTDAVDGTAPKKKANNITLGEYSCRVEVAKSWDTRQQEAVDMLSQFFKSAPQALASPGVAAQFLRLIGDGNPKVEALADLLAPGQQGGEQTPQQMQGQLQQAQQQNQQLTQALQQLHTALVTKQPELDVKKYIAELNALAGIREAQIKAGVDLSQQDADTLEHMTGLAHEAATQAADQQHQAGMQQQDQAHQAGAQASDQAAAAGAQQADQQHQQGMQASDQAHASQTQASDQQATAQQQEAAAAAAQGSDK